MNYILQELEAILYRLIVDVNHLLLAHHKQAWVTITRYQHAALLRIVYVLQGQTNLLELIFNLNNNNALVSIAADAYTQLHCILPCCAPLNSKQFPSTPLNHEDHPTDVCSTTVV